MRATRLGLVLMAGVLTLAGCDASVGEDSASPLSTRLTEDAPDPSGFIVPANLFA
ncbi:MAG: hypothetical protein IH820_18315, partial [Bacteroidetes bacterium]|nr:hypothetical protein [Bacteroidota bacterium]